jgi:DNA invertase Pin-like site-specific DNA recombinase
MQPAIAYVRVSTARQGRSGLGLDAQVASITAFAASAGFEVVDTIVEVETGKGSDALARRPQLATALEIARLTGATLVVAKLDRLTRSVEFGANLLNRGVDFRLADHPDANNFMIHILLAFAEKERQDISDRTTAALAAAKARGQRLGSPTTPGINRGRAAAFATSLRDVVTPLLHLSSRAIAAELNSRGLFTAAGAAWSSVTVLRLLARLQGAEA